MIIWNNTSADTFNFKVTQREFEFAICSRLKYFNALRIIYAQKSCLRTAFNYCDIVLFLTIERNGHCFIENSIE